MRVVVVHNRYRSANPSGENRVVDQDIEALRKAGVEVTAYFRESDEIDGFTLASKAGLAIRPTISPTDIAQFHRTIRRVRPDVVHLHNPYPLISPAIVGVANTEGIPVVQTVHNYRHACVAGTLFRAGRVCTECIDQRSTLPAVRHACYQGSRVSTLPMAAAVRVHRRTLPRITRFVSVGPATTSFLTGLGVPVQQIDEIPNSVPDVDQRPIGSRDVLFAGRLSEEKGVRLLLQAWRLSSARSTARLRIAGDGELRSVVEAAARDDVTIDYLGMLDQRSLADEYRSSGVVVVPSTCPEADPVALATAFAHGRPVVATSLGSPPAYVGDTAGWLSAPDATELASTLSSATSDLDELRRRGRSARSSYETFRSFDRSDRLVETYERSITMRPGTLALLGPDGSGKSTIADSLATSAGAVGGLVRRQHFRPSKHIPSRPSTAASEPHAQTPRPFASAAARSIIVWADFVLGGLGRRWGGASGLTVVERPWLDQVVDPRRYRLPNSITPMLLQLGRLVPRTDAAVLLTGDPERLHERKPELTIQEIDRQQQRWHELVDQVAPLTTTIDTTQHRPEQVAEQISSWLRHQRSSAAPGPVQWIRPYGIPRRVDLRVTTAPLATQSIGIYRPFRHLARLRGGVGIALARVGLAAKVPAPSIGLPDLLERGSFDGAAVIASSTHGRFVMALERGGSVASVVKTGQPDDVGLAREIEVLRTSNSASALWGLPQVERVQVDGERLILATRPIDARNSDPESLDEVERIARELAQGALGISMRHGDLAPWNLVRERGGTLVVVDWESSVPGCWPLWDLAHYVIQSGALLGRWSPPQVVRILTEPGGLGDHHVRSVGARDSAAALLARYLDGTPPSNNGHADRYRRRVREHLRTRHRPERP